MRKPDFRGWATRNGLRCSDGRTIGKDAFKDQDGQTVTMVWQHRHDDPDYVIGHAILHNAPQGVIADCYLNNSDKGATTRELVKNGDVVALSINANNLVHKGAEVVHGVIREVSVVLSGANPGALIMPTTITHGAGEEEVVTEAEIFTGYSLIEEDEEIAHASDKTEEKKEVATTEETKKPESEETVKDVFDTLSEKQKKVVYALIGAAIADKEGDDDDDSEEEKEVKHNAFDDYAAGRGSEVLTISDQIRFYRSDRAMSPAHTIITLIPDRRKTFLRICVVSGRKCSTQDRTTVHVNSSNDRDFEIIIGSLLKLCQGRCLKFAFNLNSDLGKYDPLRQGISLKNRNKVEALQ